LKKEPLSGEIMTRDLSKNWRNSPQIPTTKLTTNNPDIARRGNARKTFGVF